jgi:hypothetical protein
VVRPVPAARSAGRPQRAADADRNRGPAGSRGRHRHRPDTPRGGRGRDGNGADGYRNDRGRAGRSRAHRDRYGGADRLHLAARRPYRRPFAPGIQRNARGGLADRAAPGSHRRSGALLCALRLGTRGRSELRGRAGRRHALADRKRRNTYGRHSRDPGLGQWQRPDLPSHRLGRREFHVQRHPDGRKHLGRRSPAGPLWHRRPPRPARRSAEFLHPARRGGPEGRRRA